MSKWTRYACTVLCGLLVAQAGFAAHAGEFTVYTSPLPDFMITTGPSLDQSTGLMTEIAAAAFKAAHLNVDMAPETPWARAQALAKDQPGAILVELVRSPAREANWQWLAPVYTDTLYGFTMKGHPTWPTLADIKAQRPRIAARIGTAAVSLMTGIGISVDASPDSDDNFIKLMTGKTDLLLLQGIGIYPAMESMRQGPHRQLFLPRMSDLRRTPIMDIPLWVVTSRQTPAPEARKLTDALEKFKQTADYRAIINKYQARIPQQ